MLKNMLGIERTLDPDSKSESPSTFNDDEIS